MFEGNSLSATSRLRDLERSFAPHLKDYRAEGAGPKFLPGLSVLVFFIGAMIGHLI